MIHTTIGVYPDGAYKTNGVRCEDLAGHIAYNLLYRPGRALIVDGIVVYRGIGDVKDSLFFDIISKDIRMDKCTVPYQ